MLYFIYYVNIMLKQQGNMFVHKTSGTHAHVPLQNVDVYVRFGTDMNLGTQ